MVGDGAPEVYLETNAWSDLFRGRDTALEAQLRRDLVASARSGRYRYVTSGLVIEEIGGIAERNWPKYRDVVTFVLDLVGDGIIVPSGDLVERELRAGRPLRGVERFFSKAEITDWHRVTQQPGAVREASAELRARKRASLVDGRSRRESANAKLEELVRSDPNATGRDASAATLEWHAHAPRWIEEWSRDELANRLRSVGRDPAEAANYPLDRVPTLTNVVAQMLARVVWSNGHGRRINEGDDEDTQHYAAACYSDIFVSGDGDLGQILALMPDARLRPLSVFEFARSHLGASKIRAGTQAPIG